MTNLRKLSRDSAHRKALLRNLVTSLITHESITTTWHKAKEAQRLAERLITYGKKNTEATRSKAQAILFEPHKHLSKVFGELATRYATRAGGYTRVLRMEPKKDDQAPSAVLHFVDGPRDLRFSMVAKSLSRQRELGLPMNERLLVDIAKVTRYRENGEEELEKEVRRIERDQKSERDREKRDYENEGTEYEWVRNQRAPGRVRKRRVIKGEPGEDRFEFIGKERTSAH
jgi:large subunit ribosomal protein L17